MPTKNSKNKKPQQVVVIKETPVKKKQQKSSSQSIGRKIGSGIGGFVGDLAQKAIQKITGFGDYTVHSNSLYDGALVKSNGPPSFAARPGRGGMVYNHRHREYVCDIISAGASFSLKSFPISPSNTELFPWLSIVAQNFDQYQFKGLIFEFKTNSGTAVASTNTALGTVIAATQYNSYDQPFSNKLDMEQYEYAVSTVPSQSMIHPVECAPSSQPTDSLYVDQTSAGGDLRFSRMGVFSIATVGQQASCNIGELWVSYDIDFFKPRMSRFATGITGGGQYFRNYVTDTQSSTTGLYTQGQGQYTDSDSSLSANFGTTGTAAQGGLPNDTIQWLNMPAGNYVFIIIMTGAGATIGSPVPVFNPGYNSSTSNPTVIANYFGPGGYFVTPTSGASGTFQLSVAFNVVSAGNVALTWSSFSAYMTSRKQCCLLVSTGF